MKRSVCAMDHMELPHRHGNNEELSRLEHCMQEAESFQAVAGLCRLLSDANRVRIFWLLCHCEECVVNLAALSFVIIRYTPGSPIRRANSVPAGTTCTPRVYSRMVCSSSSLFTP